MAVVRSTFTLPRGPSASRSRPAALRRAAREAKHTLHLMEEARGWDVMAKLIAKHFDAIEDLALCEWISAALSSPYYSSRPWVAQLRDKVPQAVLDRVRSRIDREWLSIGGGYLWSPLHRPWMWSDDVMTSGPENGRAWRLALCRLMAESLRDEAAERLAAGPGGGR